MNKFLAVTDLRALHTSVSLTFLFGNTESVLSAPWRVQCVEAIFGRSMWLARPRWTFQLNYIYLPYLPHLTSLLRITGTRIQLNALKL